MKVIVSRSPADKVAPDVLVDPLCNSQPVCVAKGKAYLYDEGYDKFIYVITVPYRRKIYPSDTIAVHDGTLGQSFVARVIQHDINITNNDGALDIESVITVERSKEKGA